MYSRIKTLKIHSLRLNFVLNTIRLISSFLVPMLIFPYVSRTILPEGIGKVEFANSITSYFMLFTALGIPIYGVREIARVRDNQRELSKTVWELTLVLSLLVVLGYIVYFVLMFSVQQFKKEFMLFYIVAPTIILSNFSYEWFYQGVEDQIYITLRYIVVKVIQVILIFIFVKAPGDYLLFAAISVGMNSFSTVFNIFHLRKYISLIPFKDLDIKRHIKPVAIIFASVLATTIYMHLDVTMTGFIAGDKAVGLYTTANKLVRIIISGVTAISPVLIPRMENKLKKGDAAGYFHLLNISLGYTLILSIPCCLGIVALAKDIIYLFAGAEYGDSVVCIKLLSPIIIMVGLANSTGLQILYPHRKEWQYTVAVGIAAILNALANSILIPRYAQNGAVIGTVIAELSGLIIQIVFAWRYIIRTSLISRNTLKYIVAGFIMFVSVKYIPCVNDNVLLHCVASVCVAMAVYGGILILLREHLIIACLMKMKARMLVKRK